MTILRAQEDREAEALRLPVTTWRQYTVSRMSPENRDASQELLPRYEVVKTYRPDGFFGSGRHYASIDENGKLTLMTEVLARRRHGEDIGLYGYVECDAAWHPMKA